MTSPKRTLRSLFSLSRSPDRATRAAWWLSAAGIILMLLPYTTGHEVVITAWALLNVAITILAVIWSIGHPRPIIAARETGWKWSFWMALLLTLLVIQFADQRLANSGGTAVMSSSTIISIVAAVMWPLMFVTAAVAGLTGAAISEYKRRGRPSATGSASGGVAAFWFAIFASYLVTYALAPLHGRFHGADFISIVWLGIPIWTMVIGAGIRRGDGSAPAARRVTRWLEPRLRWRVRFRGATHVLDARGAVLGIVAALVMLAANKAGLLAPLQAPALVSMVRARASVPEDLTRGNGSATSNSGININVQPPRAGQADAYMRARGQIVLLQLDPAARRAVDTGSSECRLQATVLDRLAALGAVRVVLPVPLLNPPNTTQMGMLPASTLSGALPTSADATRNWRDLGVLLAAMRKAGNVTLAVSPIEAGAPATGSRTDVTFATLQQPGKGLAALPSLEAASRDVALAELPSFKTAGLPCVPMRWTGMPPLALLLAAAARHVKLSAQTISNEQVMDLAGRSVPQIARGVLLPVFRDTTTAPAFTTITYSDLMSNAPVYAPTYVHGVRPVSTPGTWVSSDAFIKGKVVFLDELMPVFRETSEGRLPLAMVQADATAAVMGGDCLGHVSGNGWLLALLAFGALMGQAATGKAPMDAVWKVAFGVFAALVVCGIQLAQMRWMDPVLPMATAVAAFLLSTQITYSTEREERERNRSLLQRFVAPQVVDEFLDAPEKLGLGGKRQSVVVLFADVRNFSSFAERHTPEEVIDVVNLYMTVMTDALDRHAGILDKYTGDGLMAFFPIDNEIEPGVREAMRGALAMRDAATELSREILEQGREALDVGFGVHFGEAVIGMVGNPIRQINYTALGHTVVVSARLQMLAKGGEVVVSEAVEQLIHGGFRLEGGEPVTIKGVSHPIRTYRVLSSDSTAPEVPALIGPPPHPALAAAPEVAGRDGSDKLPE